MEVLVQEEVELLPANSITDVCHPSATVWPLPTDASATYRSPCAIASLAAAGEVARIFCAVDES